MGCRETALTLAVCAPPLPAPAPFAPATPFVPPPAAAFLFGAALAEVALVDEAPLPPEAATPAPVFFAPPPVLRAGVPARAACRCGRAVFVAGTSKVTPREVTKSSMTFWSCCCAREVAAHERSAKAASVRSGRGRICEPPQGIFDFRFAIERQGASYQQSIQNQKSKIKNVNGV